MLSADSDRQLPKTLRPPDVVGAVAAADFAEAGGPDVAVGVPAVGVTGVAAPAAPDVAVSVEAPAAPDGVELGWPLACCVTRISCASSAPSASALGAE